MILEIPIPEYINPNAYVVHLPGPDGESIQVKPKRRIQLPEFYDRYCLRGFLRRVDQTSDKTPEAPPPVQSKIQISKIVNQRKIGRQSVAVPVQQEQKIRKDGILKARKLIAVKNQEQKQTVHQKPIVGRAINIDPNQLLKTNLAKNRYPISNNIGVGVLSYNRWRSLKRLIDSIIRTTDLCQTTVFISDDASDDPDTVAYLDQLQTNPNLVVIRNIKRLGIAGNNNRLLRCLSRFAFGVLLNDDIEILHAGWEYLYPDVMQRLGLHHLIYRQEGVYGATHGELVNKQSYTMRKVMERPQGAVLAFTHQFFKTVGYFDEEYGIYGMEHVDWSQKAWEFYLQEPGFFDVAGSERYFYLHAEQSVVPDRIEKLHQAKKRFAARQVAKCEASPETIVSRVSYVVPFRNFERADSILSVVNNIRGQRFPDIDIIMVEQDARTLIKLDNFHPVNYQLAPTTTNSLFNKSKAFNLGVRHARTPYVILHDADMLSQGHYTSSVMDVLMENESCHLGNTVIYTSQAAMNLINNTHIVDEQALCERVVSYYEGGSIACRVSAFWKVGGFNEDYCGYGCFEGNAKVLLADGRWKSIATIEEGDVVETHTRAAEPVIATMVRYYTGEAYRVLIEGSDDSFVVTADHKFLIIDDSVPQWVPIRNLQVGVVVRINSLSGMPLRIVLLERITYNGEVYNISVSHDHSYQVGGAIVANCEDCDFYARLSGGSDWKENRIFDFLHLWHSRVSGWNVHHENNKKLEAQLKILPMSERIALQRTRLQQIGYGGEVE